MGLELAKILYTLHATVYVGARSLERFGPAAEVIRQECPESKGALKPFIADLSSLATIRPAVDAFLGEEHRLDVLFLNAGVMTPPPGSKTKDGHDMKFGTNCLSSFLLITLLTPIMSRVSTHFCHPNSSIRVISVASLFSINTPSGGVHFETSETSSGPKQLKGMDHYMQTKSGLYFLSREFSRRQLRPQTDENGMPNRNPAGVLHITLNPGLMKTELQRHAPTPVRSIMGAVFKSPKYGAYTELYAGLSPDVKDGDFVIPWGRKGQVPEHLRESLKEGKAGEKSVSARFYEWCEEQVRPFI